MRSIFFAIATIATTFVSAQQNIVSLTSPLTGTVYTAGKTAVISWIDASVDTISVITLAQGDPAALQPVQTIASNVDATTGSYTWNVPADITPGTDYALELGTSPNMSFSGLFTIQAGDGTTPSSSASSSAPLTSSASSSVIISSSSSSSSVAVPSSSSAASSQAVSSSSSATSSASATSTPNAANKKTAAFASVMVGSAAVAMMLI